MQPEIIQALWTRLINKIVFVFINHSRKCTVFLRRYKDTRKIILHTLPVVLTVVFLIIAYCFCRCVCRKTRAREGTDKDEAKFRRKRKDIADKHKEREKERQEKYAQIKKKYIKRTEAV
ncbi:uncharacterized protein [Pocillopora verrucosa]|uniref:uncharacterized protein isoform X2 n=1 Tax=Pocillopora verrucosa TaxID=203993 RepID=UPI00333F380F